jgi:acetyl esterase
VVRDVTGKQDDCLSMACSSCYGTAVAMTRASANLGLPTWARVRRRAGDLAVHGFFRGLSLVGRLHPRARLERHGVERLANLAYLPDGMGEHQLDIYRPITRSRPLPVVLYVHGGGFRILSKDALWVMALMFAREGYVVFTINYRLAPRHPYPAAVSDCCAALEWVVDHAARYGGDPTRLVLAGESAGANLVTALTIASSYRRDERYARRIFDLGIAARAVLPACGFLQVSDPLRPRAGRRPTGFLADRLEEIADDYLRGADTQLADPVVFLERGAAPDRALPPFFIGVGAADPVRDDSQRLHVALERLGARSELACYEGEMHGFPAMVFRQNAQRYWRDAHAFVADALT